MEVAVPSCVVQESNSDSDKNLIQSDSGTGKEPPKISKNQQKRLLREARRQETKAEWRKLQKAKRRLKEQLKKEECIAKGKNITCIFVLIKSRC